MIIYTESINISLVIKYIYMAFIAIIPSYPVNITARSSNELYVYLTRTDNCVHSDTHANP